MPACPPHWPAANSIRSTRPGSDRVLAPPGAVAALVCEYQAYRAPSAQTFASEPGLRIVVTGAELSDLNTTFDVPVRTPPCSGYTGEDGYPEAEFIFRYRSGPDVSVSMSYSTICEVSSGGIGFTAGNGAISGYFTQGPRGDVLFRFNGPRA